LEKKYKCQVLLGTDGIGRKVKEREGGFELREEAIPYNGILRGENEVLSQQNRYPWEGML
jgi:hypothetical protein